MFLGNGGKMPGRDIPDEIDLYFVGLAKTLLQRKQQMTSDSVAELFGISGIDDFNSGLMKCQGCPWQFVKGLFISAGTITMPKNAYHLEFLIHGNKLAGSIADFLAALGKEPGVIERKNGQLGLYYKNSEDVVDILGYMGANTAAFTMLDAKIYRDLRNNANRISNCELANIGKTVNASDEQIKAIQKLIDDGKADDLPENLKQTLDLRVAFPDATLSELASKHTPPITKSGVNHRLAKLMEMAEK